MSTQPNPWEKLLNERFDRHLLKVDGALDRIDKRIDKLERQDGITAMTVANLLKSDDDKEKRLRAVEFSVVKGYAIAGGIAAVLSTVGGWVVNFLK